MRRRIVILLAGLALTGCSGPTSPSSQDFAKYNLPINLSQVDVASPLKLWPYGVQGGDHPNGHPGIDLTLVVGGDVIADQKGTVIDVATSVNPGERGITVRHGDGWKSYFTGFFQGINVTKGQSISQGQVLGRVDRFNGNGIAAFHWGVARDDSSEQVSCPADFVSTQARASLQQLLDQSTYPEKARFPQLCNACPAGGCR